MLDLFDVLPLIQYEDRLRALKSHVQVFQTESCFGWALMLEKCSHRLNLLRINSKFAKLKTKMMNELEKLMARKDHFRARCACLSVQVY